MDHLDEALPEVGFVRLMCVWVWARGDPSASKAQLF